MHHGARAPCSPDPGALRPLAVSALARQLLAGGAAQVQAQARVQAQVQAVHASGVSLVVPGRPDVCYLGGTGRGLLPLHVVLRTSELDRLLDRLAGAPPGQVVPLDLSGVRVFRLRLEGGAALPDAAIAPVAAWLRSQSTCGLGVAVAQALEPDALVRRTLALSATGGADGEQALRALIGRGAGSTPAGDDVLVGALAHAIVSGGENAPLAQALRRLAPEFDRLTTAAGATYLRAALEGAFGSDLLAFVRAVAAGQSPAQVLRRATRVAAHGATSGIDSLVGFVAAHEQGQNPGLQPSGE